MQRCLPGSGQEGYPSRSRAGYLQGRKLVQILNRVIIRVTSSADEVYEGVVEQQLRLCEDLALPTEGRVGILTFTMHDGTTHEQDIYLGNVLTWRNGGDLVLEE
jgi:hypothetical protein